MANILIYSSNVIGKAMAGPAIRSWEFAKALSRTHHVVLVAPNSPDCEGEGFLLMTQDDPHFALHFKEAHLLITQQLKISLAFQAKQRGIKIIIDAYDPIPLEFLERYKHSPLKTREVLQNSSINTLIFGFQFADAILCASEKQRDLWIGFLLGQKLLTPQHYDQDNSLRHFIDVVPFGLSSTAPKKTGPGLREHYGFNSTDKIVLWGGGIWNWFDPLSLIQAMKILSQTRQNIKLVFMGIKNPDPTVPEMAMCGGAIQLAKELDLFDKSVFFNHGWIPYSERHNDLLDAAIGVSIHFDHLETRYSFRTRMLDYIWTELPIVATKGDSFAELIEQHNLGSVVPYQDPEAIAQAILSLLDDQQKVDEIKANLREIRTQFYWDTVLKPVESMIQRLIQKPIKAISFQDLWTMMCFVATKIKEKGLKQTFRILIKKN